MVNFSDILTQRKRPAIAAGLVWLGNRKQSRSVFRYDRRATPAKAVVRPVIILTSDLVLAVMEATPRGAMNRPGVTVANPPKIVVLYAGAPVRREAVFKPNTDRPSPTCPFRLQNNNVNIRIGKAPTGRSSILAEK